MSGGAGARGGAGGGFELPAGGAGRGGRGGAKGAGGAGGGAGGFKAPEFVDGWKKSLEGKTAKDLANQALKNTLAGVPFPDDITGPGGYVEMNGGRPPRRRAKTGDAAKDQFQDAEDGALNPFIDGTVSVGGAVAVLVILFVFVFIIGPPPS